MGTLRAVSGRDPFGPPTVDDPKANQKLASSRCELTRALRQSPVDLRGGSP
jgi:hypothetical protein